MAIHSGLSHTQFLTLYILVFVMWTQCYARDDNSTSPLHNDSNNNTTTIGTNNNTATSAIEDVNNNTNVDHNSSQLDPQSSPTPSADNITGLDNVTVNSDTSNNTTGENNSTLPFEFKTNSTSDGNSTTVLPQDGVNTTSITPTNDTEQNISTVPIVLDPNTTAPPEPKGTRVLPITHLPHNLEHSWFSRTFTVGRDKGFDIIISKDWNNETDTEDAAKQWLRSSFSDCGLRCTFQGIRGGYNMTLDLRRRDLVNQTATCMDTWLNRLSNNSFITFNVNMSSFVSEIEKFQADVCYDARVVCPLGYECHQDGCQHMCSTDATAEVCNGHGECVVDIDVTFGSNDLYRCRCSDTYYHYYSGQWCQNSRMGDGQWVAIVVGVLAGLCSLLLVAVICVCVRWRRDGQNYTVTSDRQMYAISNRSYEPCEFDHSPKNRQ